MQEVVPQLPPNVPKMGNALTRWFGRVMLRLSRWRVVGGLPDVPKFIVIAAPHTSNWDWVVAMFALLGLGVRINYLIKSTAFFWPLSVILRLTGGVPVDRSAPAGMVEGVARRVAANHQMIVVITPEGTRRRVEAWKTGFLRIAKATALPVVQVSWDYPSRTITLGPVAELSGDLDVDMQRVRDYYRQFTGKNPANQSP
jgi:1-acyl-sn-glycerol-3-phosphate acyltransferase